MAGVKGMRLGVIFGNRDFFPDVLVSEARRDLEQLLQEMGIDMVALTPQQTKLGAVETWKDAALCGKVLREQKNRLDGVLVCLPNFGDERSIADSLRASELQCPVLVQACPDDLDQFGLERRRDAFCGKISVCNNLRQYGIKFSLTRGHTVAIKSERFRRDLEEFLTVCRVVKGLRHARIGAVGARPNNFNTTRCSEKLLEASGISVSTIDLSEVLGMVGQIESSDKRVKERVEAIRAYADSSAASDESLVRMAKFAVVLEDWSNELGLQATAIQCWSSLQKNFHANVCTVMSMMSERMMPSACEVDIAGAVSMYSLQLASGGPSALADWNNNYGDEDDKCVLFHCGNWPKTFLPEARMAAAEILGSTLGNENTMGALAGRTPAGPLTFGRVSTDDVTGKVRAYVGEGSFTSDPLNTVGAKAVVQVPRLPELMQYICRNGFEHHTAMTGAHCAAAVAEALGVYMGWDVLRHS
jgi:L-fucose isomerase-like protein